MFPLTFCYISPRHWMPSSGLQHADTEGKTSWRNNLQKDLQLWQCKLFGCHLFPCQLLAKFTLKCATFISFKLQRIGFPASTTQSVPEEAAAWSMLCFHLCRMAPKIFPTWDWPFDYQPPMRCPSSSRLQSTGNGTHRCKGMLIDSVSRFSLRYGKKKINLIVTKLFLDGWQCGRFKSIIACPCSMLSLQSDHTNASYLLIPSTRLWAPWGHRLCLILNCIWGLSYSRCSLNASLISEWVRWGLQIGRTYMVFGRILKIGIRYWKNKDIKNIRKWEFWKGGG